MDSRAHLDYVLFQLTPTRTRCDLVIFTGNLSEKLAYGLLEPFIAHLRSAKDQISKGGYSVTLRPPSSENSWWFTKGTLQRFVRFVSTPEVLERFVTIEREISQLENSIKSFEASNADVETDANGVGSNSKTSAVSSKTYGESNDSTDLEKEENSKARLHRVVETRTVVLRKEQAMVYARALAAGFEMGNLNDLLLFSDAFGASRLREACINFRDLCKRKNEDRLWVDEIAAMQAIMQPDLSFMGTSGVILAGEDNNDPLTAGNLNGSADNSFPDTITNNGTSDTNQAFQTPEQMQHPWVNQFAQHIRNFQGPMFQQIPPYQGYGFPGMQVAPPYYPGNMQWPLDVNGLDNHESYDRDGRKSSSKKKSKASKVRESEDEDHDGSTETDSSSDKSHRKKNGKKSSRKVVIRNINYITSKRDGEKNSASVKNSVDQNGNKGSEGWDAFQQLLLKEDSETSVPEAKTVPVEEEYFSTKRSTEKNSTAFMPDAFLVTERGIGSYGSSSKISDQNFERNKGNHPVMRKGSTPEEILFSRRSDEQDNARVSLSDNAARSSVIRSHASDDWFVSKQSGEGMNQGKPSHLRFIDGDFVPSTTDKVGKRDKDTVIDDSLLIQGRVPDDHYEGQLRTEIMEASFVEKGTTEAMPRTISESKGFYEPDELYMALDRDTVVEQTVPSWNPEIDIENNASLNNPAKKSDTDASADLNSNEKGPNKKSGASATKSSSRDARARTAGGPMRRGKPEITPPGPRRSTFGSKTSTPKSQFEKDEVRKKRMEELLVRRQKRIAERGGDQPVRASLGSDKLKRQPPAEATKKPKPILRSSTIDRLAVAKTTTNSPTPKPKKDTSKLKGANVKSGSQKTRDVHPKKVHTNKISSSGKKPENGDLMGVSSSTTGVKEAKATDRTDAAQPPRENASDEVDDSKDIKELHVTSLISTKDVNMVVQMSPSYEKVTNPLADHSTISDSVKKGVDGMSKKSVSFLEDVKVSDDHDKTSPELSIHPVPESPTKRLSSSLMAEGNRIKNENTRGSPIISVIEESTPPTTNGTILESTQSRKKWDGPENAPKSVKGFRKLLMFGRKS